MDKKLLISKYQMQLKLTSDKKSKSKEIAKEINLLPISKQEKIDLIKKIFSKHLYLEHSHFDYYGIGEKRASANDEYLELVAIMLGEIK